MPRLVERIVCYMRISTGAQGRSGLGLEAQRDIILHFAESEGLEIVAELEEVGTGRGLTRSSGAQCWPRRCSSQSDTRPRCASQSWTG